jgi:hypothetical protein
LQLQGRPFGRAELLDSAASVWPLIQDEPSTDRWARAFIEAGRVPV